METSELHAMSDEIKKLVNALFEKYYVPRIEKHIELKLDLYLERMVRDRMKCPKHPKLDAFIFTDGGEIRAQCVWCIREEAVENFKKQAGIMAGGNGTS